MQKIIDEKLLKFVLVGLLNTIFSAVLMFLFYNLLCLGYWGSSSIAYILSSIMSFILNKKFTFKNEDSVCRTAGKFIINIAICYLIAYSLAQPCITLLLSGFGFDTKFTEQAAMLFGMILFTGLNYFGQRFFAFKEKISK